MAFENFRQRQAGLLAGFDFTDDDIRAAVRAVRARKIEPTDKFVVAQLKLHFMGKRIQQHNREARLERRD